ncbi:uncharacterized protein LOC128732642 [Sabethes cyaneus]|uniref:uncharacterized protein LOC128732642 n=1 Tax=Sabethes cyaneus TaxID=53552 RepID=UPI00237E06A3|nr:uncharacterized protein LOC128732642 [Sabethes cyaneus]
MNWTPGTIVGTVKPVDGTVIPVVPNPVVPPESLALPVATSSSSKPLQGTIINPASRGQLNKSDKIAGTIKIAGSNQPGISADELTKRAIDEIQQDVRIGRVRAGQVGALGWRPCPLRKTNKRFLNRTVHSAVQHNKREAVRHFHSSTRKLIELDQADSRYRQSRKRTGGREMASGDGDSATSRVVVIDELEEGEVRDD